MKESNSDLYSNAARSCACARFRRASRAVTQLFDQHLEASGLRATQLIILLEIGSGRARTIPILGRRLVMDRSSVARSVARLIEGGYLQRAPRGRTLSLTPAGDIAVQDAVPLWRIAQEQIVRNLGEERWCELLEVLEESVQAAASPQKEAS